MPNLQDRLYAGAPAWLQTVLLNAHAVRVVRHRYGHEYRETLRWMLAREHISTDEIRSYQDTRLKQMVRVAYDQTDYYRYLFDNIGLSPDDIHGVDDLHLIPVLTKDTLRTEGHRMWSASSPRRGWLHGHTSGSTGTPLSLWYDRHTCNLTNAIDSQHKRWAGATTEDWFAMLLGRTVVPPAASSPPFWRPNYVQRQLWMSSFHLRDDWMGLYADEIRRRSIRFIEGYPSTLYAFAGFLLEHGIQLPMQAAISSSETLHHTQREVIEEAFKCPLFDFYASAERVVFSAECQAHMGKHIAEEYGIVEIVDEAGMIVQDGTAGALVGTTLHNAAMPLLRYRLGDVSMIVPQRCDCGRTSRLMANVTTKAEDVIAHPDGRSISPTVLTHPFKPIRGIVRSQIVQDRLDHINIYLVVDDKFTAAQREALLWGITERLGESIALEICLVEDIPREPSGKYRWVISKVERTGRLDWEAESP